MADMLWQWILNEIVSLQQKSSLWNTQGAFCIFLFFCAISIDDRLNLFHQSIIIVLIINPAEHRITYNITISIDQYCCRKCHDIGRVFPCIWRRVNGKIAIFSTLALEKSLCFFYGRFISIEGFCIDAYDFAAHWFDCIV